MSRKFAILSCLFAVGLVSFAFSIITDPNLSTQQALLALGTEGLKTAVLFVLVDYLIGDHERRKEERDHARLELDLAAGNSSAGIKEYLDRIELNGKISMDLTSKHSFFGQIFSNRKFINSSWDSADFSKSEFSNCELDNLLISNLSFRGAIFDNVKFKKVNLTDVDMTRSLFVDCTFESSSLLATRCLETRFSSCRFFAMNKEAFPKSGTEYEGCMGVPRDVT